MEQSGSSGIVSLEDAMEKGEGICAEVWSVQTSQGKKVQITLWFDPAMVQTPEGRTSITCTAPEAVRS